jgi:hypothetical protein
MWNLWALEDLQQEALVSWAVMMMIQIQTLGQKNLGLGAQ